MFLISKLLWILLNPGAIFLYLLLVGAALLFTRWRRAGRRVLTATAVVALVIAFVPFGSWMMTGLENRFPAPKRLPDRVTGIIVLGGAIAPAISRARGQLALNRSAERLIAFVDLARRFPDAKLVFSGGSGDPFDQKNREADAAPEAFRVLGLSPSRVVYESASRNTYENALRLRARLRPTPGQKWLLVTSASHMPRAIGTFRKAGWTVIAYPVDFSTTGSIAVIGRFDFAAGLAALTVATREWVGLIAYFALGRSDSLFPAPK